MSDTPNDNQTHAIRVTAFRACHGGYRGPVSLNAAQEALDAQVVEAFASIAGMRSIWRGCTGSESVGTYSAEFDQPAGADEVRMARKALVMAAAKQVRTTYPDFRMSVYRIQEDDQSLDGAYALNRFPNATCVWRANVPWQVEAVVRAAFSALSDVVAIVPPSLDDSHSAGAPEARLTDTDGFATLIARVPHDQVPEDLCKFVAEIRTRRLLGMAWTIQVAPELNFPPQGVRDVDNPDAGTVAHLCRVLLPVKSVEGIWCRRGQTAHGTKSYRFWVLSRNEDDVPAVSAAIEEANAAHPGMASSFVWQPVASLVHVPKDAECVFNNVTRLLVAASEQDTDEVVRIRQRMGLSEADAKAGVREGAPALSPDNVPTVDLRGKRESSAPALTPADAGMAARRGPFVRCRWCQVKVPASVSPDYQETCGSCGALLAATTIPTKSEAMPLISLFVNPDGTAYVELVFKPPKAGRWDLSPVRRYTVPAALAEHFTEHPMGRKDPGAYDGE